MLLNSNNTFALSLSQQDIYTEQKLYKNNPMYNIGGVIHLNTIDEAKLKVAHKKLITEHDAFGIRILECDNELLQYVSKERNVELEIIDFSKSNTPEDDAGIWLKNLFETCFDINNSELFRSFLLKISTDIYQYVGFAHHLIMDGWGFANWAKLLGEYYNDSSPQVIASWHDAVASDMKYLESNRYLKNKLYWTTELSSIPENLIPKLNNNKFKDKSLVPSQRKILKVSSLLHQGLKLKAKSTGSNVVHAYLTIVCSYFAKLNDRSEFIIGIPAHNRRSAVEKNQVGLFTSISPLKVFVNSDDIFFDLCNRLGTKMKKNYRHQRFPISHMKNILPSKNMKLFDVGFNYLKLDSQLNIEEKKAELEYLSHNHEQTPLVITIWEYEDSEEIEVQFDHNLGYLSEDDANLLKDRFEWILKQVVEQGIDNIHDINLIPDNELNKIQGLVKGLKSNYPKDKCIHELFEAQVIQTPDNLAVVFENKQLTYRELNEHANQLAHYLRDQGIQTETLVGICVERSLDMVIAIMAILKSGGAYVPLDASYPHSRLEYMISDTKIAIVLTQTGLLSDFDDKYGVQRIELDTEYNQQLLSGYSTNNLSTLTDQNGKSLAYVIYTSGSTGQPKGVLMEHQSVVSFASKNQYIDIDSITSVLALSNVVFDGSVFDLFVPLLHGKSTIIVGKDNLTNVDHWNELIQQHDINSVFLTTALFNQMSHDSLEVLQNFEQLLFGGERAVPQFISSYLESSTTNKLIHVYGPTETAVFATSVELTLNNFENLPIGSPINNKSIYLINASNELTPLGAIGEICIGGSGIARGYLNQPELTAEKFITDPFNNSTDERLYKTGDLARYLPDGNIEFIGRVDDQVKIRGCRIEFGEIEHCLSAIPNVKSSIIIVKEEKDGNKRLIAYVVYKDQNGYKERDIATYIKNVLASKLPSYMVPLAIVLLDEFPLTPNGKIDKNSLPVINSGHLQSEYVEPVTSTEKIMVAIWTELLNFDAETISVTANFFELGGDSLLLTRLCFLVNKRFSLNIEMSDLYSINNLQMMSHAIDEAIDIVNKSIKVNKTIMLDL